MTYSMNWLGAHINICCVRMLVGCFIWLNILKELVLPPTLRWRSVVTTEDIVINETVPRRSKVILYHETLQFYFTLVWNFHMPGPLWLECPYYNRYNSKYALSRKKFANKFSCAYYTARQLSITLLNEKPTSLGKSAASPCQIMNRQACTIVSRVLTGCRWVD